jgi:hypothetical protein
VAAPVEPASRPRAKIARVVAPPAEERVEAPVQEEPVGTSPERLARMIGTEVQVDEAGNATVEVPGPGPSVPFSTAPRTATLSRSPAAPAPPPEPPKVDVDQIAETVMDKLRRELLIEREQSGGAWDLS